MDSGRIWFIYTSGWSRCDLSMFASINGVWLIARLFQNYTSQVELNLKLRAIHGQWTNLKTITVNQDHDIQCCFMLNSIDLSGTTNGLKHLLDVHTDMDARNIELPHKAAWPVGNQKIRPCAARAAACARTRNHIHRAKPQTVHQRLNSWVTIQGELKYKWSSI